MWTRPNWRYLLRNHKALLAVIAVLVLCVPIGARAAERVIWQLGQFDNNYAELAIPGNYGAYRAQFPKDVDFTIGKDEPAKSWPFIHPGPDDVWAPAQAQGGGSHTFRIHFDLPEQPKGVFTLTIDMVSTHPFGPPTYSVAVNGQGGQIDLPAGSDEALTDPAKGKEYVLVVPLPASELKQGRNVIALSNIRGSWLIYDALRMTNDPQGGLPEVTVSGATLVPTTRFTRSGPKLKQIAELSVKFSRGMAAAEAVVVAGKSTQKVSLKSGLLGEAIAQVSFDEMTRPTPVQCTITCQGQAKASSFSLELKPQRHWKLYVQDSTHVDIGYTDYQEHIITRHNDNMSAALDLCAQYPDFKWNTEAAWVENNYLSLMPPARQAQFIKLAREGRIGCQAIYGNMLTGICSHEELIRDLYYARSISKKYGIPFDIAMSSDVPTQVWTLPMILAGSGIHYFTSGLNLTRGNSFGRLFGKSPFYWQGPDGSRVLTWLSPGYAQAGMLRLASGVEQVMPQVDNFLHGFERKDYPYDAALAFGGFGDNQPMGAKLARVVQEWNKRYAYPKIILCRGPEFFRDIEKQQVKPGTLVGDAGVYWEDGAGSSAAETATVRTAKETLATAEKLLALTSAGAAYPGARITSAWRNAILYDEHTWGAAGSISDPKGDQTVHQWEYKSRFAHEAGRIADSVLQTGLESLAKAVKPADDCTLVFNPLSWSASGLVQTTSARGESIEQWVDGVPPLGYVTLPYSRQDFPATNLSHDNTIENDFYKITINPSTGAVQSLIDKELGRELVDAAAQYGVNQYVYIKGQGEKAQDVTRSENPPAVTIDVEETAYYKRAVIKGSAYNAPAWTSEIVLWNTTKRIDFKNTLHKTETTDKEAVYFAFPFKFAKPRFHVELPDGEMRPDKDILDGACMSWYCAQDYAAVEEPGCAVVWTAVDSPLLTLGTINQDTFKSPLPLDNGHIYAYVMNNYWFTNYKASQGGEMVFRFALTSMPKYDRVAATRFGQTVRNPLRSMFAKGVSKPAGKSTASLCSATPDNVVIQTIKQAESGKGLIIRLREVGGKKTQATITLPTGHFKEARLCNLVEDEGVKLNIAAGKVRVPVAANGLATVLVR
jgi:alpha-mannosidase